MTTQINKQTVVMLRDIAELLEKQHANPFRVRAYFNAADTVEKLKESLQKIIQNKGIQGLIDLPTIGVGIARSIYEYIATGHMTRLDKLQGQSDPVSLFQSIPGVGEKLARRIHDQLDIDSLEALQMACLDDRLSRVEGLGESRLKSIEAWLFTILGQRRPQSKAGQLSVHEPSIELLLRVDEEYRKKTEAGKLPMIAPKRFNPEGKQWLSILHVTHGDWHFTALYSNTALAHKLNRIHDWVVIYFYDDHHQEGQHTVVTETKGPLVEKRVVRGRESECIDYYT